MWEADNVHRIDLLVASNRFKTSISVSLQMFSRRLFDLAAIVLNFIYLFIFLIFNKSCENTKTNVVCVSKA